MATDREILRVNDNAIDYSQAWRKLCLATLDSVGNGEIGKAQYIAKLSYPHVSRMDSREFGTIYYLGLQPMKLSQFVEHILVLQIQTGHTYTIRSIRNSVDQSTGSFSDLTIILGSGTAEEHLYIRLSSDLPDITDLGNTSYSPVCSVKNAREVYSSAGRLVIDPNNKKLRDAQHHVDALAKEEDEEDASPANRDDSSEENSQE